MMYGLAKCWRVVTITKSLYMTFISFHSFALIAFVRCDFFFLLRFLIHCNGNSYVKMSLSKRNEMAWIQWRKIIYLPKNSPNKDVRQFCSSKSDSESYSTFAFWFYICFYSIINFNSIHCLFFFGGMYGISAMMSIALGFFFVCNKLTRFSNCA